MKATYRILFPGNIAIQEEIWTLDTDAAKAVKKHFQGANKGGYWYNAAVRPINCAARQHRPVTIRTGGFSTGEFANILFNLGIEYTRN